ncbi:MAG: anti-sigma factor antagonist [Eubacterium sp.]
MEVLYEVRGENLLIYLPEELDHHNAKIITEQSDWYIVSNQIKNIIFNFKRTSFMDSSGIGVIMGRYKLIKSLGGEITVTNINQSIDRIFTISGLYKLVNKAVTSSLTK